MEKIRLKLKAYDHRVLDRNVASIIETVKRSGETIPPCPTTVQNSLNPLYTYDKFNNLSPP